MNLALFDFDGTITTEDTFTQFIFHSAAASRILAGLPLLLPVLILYKLRLLPASVTRPIVARVAFWNRYHHQVAAAANTFASEYLPTVIRPEAQARLEWHQAQGDEIYVVSASLDPYLSQWCAAQGIKLLCSQLETKGSKLTGRYVSGDCSNQRKVERIKAEVDLSKFGAIYAYGDTREDLPMLMLAQHSFYRWKRVIEPEDSTK